MSPESSFAGPESLRTRCRPLSADVQVIVVPGATVTSFGERVVPMVTPWVPAAKAELPAKPTTPAIISNMLTSTASPCRPRSSPGFRIVTPCRPGASPVGRTLNYTQWSGIAPPPGGDTPASGAADRGLGHPAAGAHHAQDLRDQQQPHGHHDQGERLD